MNDDFDDDGIPDLTEPRPDDHTHDTDEIESLIGEEVDDDDNFEVEPLKVEDGAY